MRNSDASIFKVIGKTLVAAMGMMLLPLATAHAATVNWTNASGDGKWSTTSNWSTGKLPTTADIATFDPAIADADVAIPSAINLGGINIKSGYTKTITQENSATITIGSSAYVQAGGNFVGSNATITINGTITVSGGNFTAGSGKITSNSSLTVSGGNVIAGAGDIAIRDLNISSGTFLGGTGNMSISALNLSGGDFTAPSGVLSVGWYWTHLSGGTFNHNSGSVVFVGGGGAQLRVNAVETFHNMEIKRDNGYYLSLSGSGYPVVMGKLTLTDGMLTYGKIEVQGALATTSTFDLPRDSDTEIIVKGPAERTVTLAPDSKLTRLVTIDAPNAIVQGPDSGTFTFPGTFKFLAGKFIGNAGHVVVMGTMTQGGGEISLSSGDFTANSTFTISNGTFTGGTGSFTVKNIFTISGGVFTAPSGQMYANWAWIHTAGGTFNHNGGSVTIGVSTESGELIVNVMNVETFNNLKINRGTYVELRESSDRLVILGTLTFAEGGSTGGGTYEAYGDVVLESNFDYAQCLLKFMGSNDQTFTANGTYDRYNGNIVVEKSGGKVNLGSDLTLDADKQTLTITSGTLNLNGYNLKVNGLYAQIIAQNGGTLQLNGSETVTTNSGYPQFQAGSTALYTGSEGPYDIKNYAYHHLTIGGTGTFRQASTLDVNGDLNILSGTLDSSGYPITLAGNWVNNSTYISGGNAITFDGVNQAISGSTTFGDIKKNTSSAASLTFPGGLTTTISGTTDLQGASGGLLSLRSSGGNANVDFQGNRTFRYLDVKDNHNVNAVTALCLTGCKDSGNNVNWLFFANVQFQAAVSSNNETTTSAALTLTLDQVLEEDATVQYAVTGGTATSGTDYTLTAGTATIAKGTQSTTIPLTIINDNSDEADETIVVSLSSPSNAALGSITSHTYTIVDDDAAPTVAFSTATSDISENTTPDTLIITLAGTSSQEVAVNYQVSGGSATENTDYTLLAGQAVIPAGQNQAIVSLGVINDTTDESDETVEVAISNPINAELGSITFHTTTIRDDDTPPSVSFVLSTSTGEENVSAASLEIKLSDVSGKPVSVTYAITDGTATGAGTDYTLESQTITLPAGSLNATIPLSVADDAIDEFDESLQVTLSDPQEATLGMTTTHTYTIIDDDTAGVSVQQSGTNTQVAEGSAETDSYTVVLTSEPTSDVSVTLNAGDGIALTPSTLVFTPTDWNVVQTVEVAALDDNSLDGLRSVTITHSLVSSDLIYATIVPDPIPVEIADNDVAGVSIIESGDGTAIAEGGTSDTYQVVLTSKPDADVEVTLTPDSQATVSPTSLIFTPENWNTAQEVTITAVDDSSAEKTHTGTVTHTAESTDGNYSGIAISQVVATIADNDAAGVSIIESDSTTAVTEGGAPDTYMVVLTSKPAQTVTITIGADAQLITDLQTLTFTPENWNLSQTVTVAALDDTSVEDAVPAAILHSAASDDTQYNGIPVTSVVVTITDNDLVSPPTDEGSGDTGGGDTGGDNGSGDTGSGDTDGSDDSGSSGGDIGGSMGGLGAGGSGSNGGNTGNDHPTPQPGGTGEPASQVGASLPRMVIGKYDNQFVYEEQIEGRLYLYFPGDKTIVLPAESTDTYTFATTSTGYLAIGISNLDDGRGRVYLSKLPLDQLPAQTDLNSVTITRQALTIAQLEAGDRRDRIEAGTETDGSFIAIRGNDAGDALGAYLTLGNFGDHGQRFLISSPNIGQHGLLYIYNDHAELSGLIRGTATRPVWAILTGDYILDDEDDLLFGPKNRTLNQTLYREGPLASESKMQNPFLLSGRSAILSDLFNLDEQDVNVAVASDLATESLALGDVNGDDVDDLVRVTEDGTIAIHFGPIQSVDKLILREPNVIVSGGKPEDGFGRSLTIGDFSDDGIGDIAVGAPECGETDTGCIYIIYGRDSWTASLQLTSALKVSGAAGDHLGNDFFTIDVNEDGQSELLATKAGRSTQLLTFERQTSQQTLQQPQTPATGGEPEPADPAVGPGAPGDGSFNINGTTACSLSMDASVDSRLPLLHLVTAILFGLSLARRVILKFL